MKKRIAFVLTLCLALTMCLSLCACGETAPAADGTAPKKSSAVVPKKAPMYVPGSVMETDFGSITVLDAAFCAKAQLGYTVSTISRKSTINGKTESSSEETVHPICISAQDNKLIFGLRTVMTNTTGQDIQIHELPVTAKFGKDSTAYFSKGGNVHISDEAYKVLPAGGSAEIILAAQVPVEQYAASSECLLEAGGAQLGFSFADVNIYNALGYQEGDNTPVTIDEVIQAAGERTSVNATEAETEPQETQPPIETTPGVAADGASSAEGRAITVENVGLGFCDTLPSQITTSSQYERHPEQFQLDDSMTYAVVQFRITNLTPEEMKLVDLHGDFAVQVTYNKTNRYSTYGDVDSYIVFENGFGRVRKRSSSSSGNETSLSSLGSKNVSVYIPCSRVVEENTDKSLTVTFISKHSGNENLTFTIR